MALDIGGKTKKLRKELEDITGQPQDNGIGGVPYAKEFNTDDFDTFGNTSTTVGVDNEIAKFKVPADTMYSWGYGKAKNEANQGYLYVDLADSDGNSVDGTIKLVVQSSTERQEEVIKEFDTSRLDASQTDRKQQVPLPEQVQAAIATKDSYLKIMFDPNNEGNVSGSESTVIFPVTEYDLSQEA